MELVKSLDCCLNYAQFYGPAKFLVFSSGVMNKNHYKASEHDSNSLYKRLLMTLLSIFLSWLCNYAISIKTI
jgi:hypothetical protein